MAVYSKKATIELTQNIRISSYRSLRNSKTIKAGYRNNMPYGLIVFYDKSGNMQMAIQIIGDDSPEDATYQWMNYLGLLLPSEKQEQEDKDILPETIRASLLSLAKLVLLWGGGGSEWEKLSSKEVLTVQEIAEARKMIEKIEDDEKRAEAYLELQMKVPYHNQRDNTSLATEKDILNNDWMTSSSTAGDIMCNLTSQAMCLEYLGISPPCPDCASECDTCTQFEDYLECMRVNKGLAHRGDSEARKKLTELFNNLSFNHVTLNTCDKAKIEKELKSSLEKGCSVLISAFGHIVRLKGITDEGLVVDDPYGKVIDFSKSGCTPKYKKDGTDYRNGKGFSEENGKNNVWKWTDLSANNVIIKSAEIYCSK